MWVKASELQEKLGKGFSRSTIKRRRQNFWKLGKHYRIITPPGVDPRFQYNVKEIEKSLMKTF